MCYNVILKKAEFSWEKIFIVIHLGSYFPFDRFRNTNLSADDSFVVVIPKTLFPENN